MLLDAEGLRESGSEDGNKMLGRLISMLSVSTRETDLVGWYETGQALGVLFTEVSPEKRESIAQVLRAKITNALNEELGSARVWRIHVTAHIFFDNRGHERDIAAEVSVA
jgi:GGDEF domain-containing protein